MTLKVILVAALKRTENLVQTVATRYIVKNFISGIEISFHKWFTLEFYRTIGWRGMLGLLGIASFTLVSFPLGIWLSSFSAGSFYPLNELVNTVYSMIMIPVTLWGFQKTVGEISFNQSTLFGIVLIEIGGAIGLAGWWFIYNGNKG